MKKANSQNAQGYQTPNEKYDAEFGAEQNDVAQKVQQAKTNKVQENFQTPNEKFDAEFGTEPNATAQKVQQSKMNKKQ
ncbi:hypothetical protein ACFQ3J_12055 [Paenibacillus provencensis]|uniref:Small, acid-soluble spore protein gamma-type n=1 Tax=Paenibacillus provencensis TaxID=441151 RepID=A0ABW3PYK1_9BACL|nr:hypothetical protein [Paenibacillus sp. MER 78]MCM3127374.1 hypothetical protein [Paenibacillus sp. MER 78]